MSKTFSLKNTFVYIIFTLFFINEIIISNINPNISNINSVFFLSIFLIFSLKNLKIRLINLDFLFLIFNVFFLFYFLNFFLIKNNFQLVYSTIFFLFINVYFLVKNLSLIAKKKLLDLLILFSFLVSIYTIFSLLETGLGFYVADTKYSSTSLNYFSSLILVLIYIYKEDSFLIKKNLFYLIVLLVILASYFLVFSRKELLTIFLILIYLFFTQYKFINKKKIISLFLLITISVLPILIFFDAWSIFLLRFGLNEDYGILYSISSRLNMVVDYFDHFELSFFGNAEVIKNYSYYNPRYGLMDGTIHNIYLFILHYFGYFGLFFFYLFITLILLITKKKLNNYENHNYILIKVVVLASILIGFTSTALYQISFWFLLGSILGIFNNEKDTISNRN